MKSQKASVCSVVHDGGSIAIEKASKPILVAEIRRLVRHRDLLQLSVDALMRDNKRLRRMARNRMVRINLLKK